MDVESAREDTLPLSQRKHATATSLNNCARMRGAEPEESETHWRVELVVEGIRGTRPVQSALEEIGGISLWFDIRTTTIV